MNKMITTRDRRVEKMQAANWRELQLQRTGVHPPPRLEVSDERIFFNVLPDGSWEGKSCFLIGGGPSLRGFDFSRLAGELTIGINRAYERHDCTIMFFMDSQYHEWITNGEMGAEAKAKFQAFKGLKACLYTMEYDYPKGIYLLPCAGGDVFGESMEFGLGSGTNSGYAALNLAVCLGANPIYLLGFDMNSQDGKQEWWHDGYPVKQEKKVYQQFRRDFEAVAPELASRGVRVVNLNPQSELRCFEFGKEKNRWI